MTTTTREMIDEVANYGHYYKSADIPLAEAHRRAALVERDLIELAPAETDPASYWEEMDAKDNERFMKILWPLMIKHGLWMLDA